MDRWREGFDVTYFFLSVLVCFIDTGIVLDDVCLDG